MMKVALLSILCIGVAVEVAHKNLVRSAKRETAEMTADGAWKITDMTAGDALKAQASFGQGTFIHRKNGKLSVTCDNHSECGDVSKTKTKNKCRKKCNKGWTDAKADEETGKMPCDTECSYEDTDVMGKQGVCCTKKTIQLLSKCCEKQDKKGVCRMKRQCKAKCNPEKGWSELTSTATSTPDGDDEDDDDDEDDEGDEE